VNNSLNGKHAINIIIGLVDRSISRASLVHRGLFLEIGGDGRHSTWLRKHGFIASHLDARFDFSCTRVWAFISRLIGNGLVKGVLVHTHQIGISNHRALRLVRLCVAARVGIAVSAAHHRFLGLSSLLHIHKLDHNAKQQHLDICMYGSRYKRRLHLITWQLASLPHPMLCRGIHGCCCRDKAWHFDKASSFLEAFRWPKQLVEQVAALLAGKL
jgi:hypothetical protein